MVLGGGRGSELALRRKSSHRQPSSSTGSAHFPEPVSSASPPSAVAWRGFRPADRDQPSRSIKAVAAGGDGGGSGRQNFWPWPALDNRTVIGQTLSRPQ